MIKFYKVSYEQFKKDLLKTNKLYHLLEEEKIRKIYDEIKLPKRATRSSAGYDFYAPISICFLQNESEIFPTGIRAEMDENVVLLLAPRSSLGFKHRLVIDNTIGVIDADYFNADNEGHIHCKMHFTSNEEVFEINKGDAYMQGIFINYLKTDDDEVSTIRTGGIGSTSK